MPTPFTGRRRRPRGPQAEQPLSVMLWQLAHDPARERVALADVLAHLGDRALAALIFVFAAPNALPMPPGTSAVLGAPLFILSAQLMLGRKPWLPQALARRSLKRTDFAILVRRLNPWLQKAERLLRPRLQGLTEPPWDRFLGLVCLLMALLVVLPIPMGNMLPGLAAALIGLGLMEEDGAWALAGLAAALAGTVLVSGVIGGVALAAWRWLGG